MTLSDSPATTATCPVTHTGAGRVADEVNLFDPVLLSDPFNGFAQLRAERPITKGVFVDGSPIWYITRYDDVRAVLDDPRFLHNPPAAVAEARTQAARGVGVPAELIPYVTNDVVNSDPPHHTRLRRLIGGEFTPRRVENMRPRIEQITADLLDGLAVYAEDGVVDLLQYFAYPLPLTVICELFGVPEEDWEEWRVASGNMTSGQPHRLVPGIRVLVDRSRALIRYRREHPGADLVSALLAATDAEQGEVEDQPLDEDELVTMVLGMIIAGHEASAHLVTNGMVTLIGYPEQARRMREDPSLIRGAVEELLRHSSAPQIASPRYAAEDIDFGGHQIKAGDAILPILYSANHDEEVFPDPAQFDIDRVAAGRGEQHVAFGHGIHYCGGAALARVESEIAFRMLLDRYPDMALVSQPDQLDWSPTPGHRRLDRLYVRLNT